MLYVLAEVAIAACDLAEVLGMAIGIQLLTGLPLIWGVLITVLDTFLFLLLATPGHAENGSLYYCTGCYHWFIISYRNYFSETQPW